jgi:hypothetical protein
MREKKIRRPKGWWLRRRIDYGSGLKLIVIAMDSGKGGPAKHGRRG